MSGQYLENSDWLIKIRYDGQTDIIVGVFVVMRSGIGGPADVGAVCGSCSGKLSAGKQV